MGNGKNEACEEYQIGNSYLRLKNSTVTCPSHYYSLGVPFINKYITDSRPAVRP